MSSTADSGPTFSILLPVYNGEKLVGRAIESVLDQSCPAWELLVVDDGSTDGSLGEVRRVAAADERVRVIPLRRNSGSPAHPRNVALAAATATYVCLLDQDDAWAPDKLEQQLAKHASEDFGIVYSDAWVVESDGSRFRFSERWGPQPEGQVAEALIAGCFVPALTVAVRRDVMTRTGGFDTTLPGVDDYDYWLRLAFAGERFGRCVEPLAEWHLHGANLSLDRRLSVAAVARCIRRHSAAQSGYRAAFERRLDSLRTEALQVHLDAIRRESGIRPLTSGARALPLVRSGRDAARLGRAVASGLLRGRLGRV